MGLIKYCLAVGIGYHFGQPHGRQQLLWLRQQTIELARKPAITQLRERGLEIAGERAVAAKNLAAKMLSGKSRAADADATTPVDDDTAAIPWGRDRGLRGRGWRRPRPNPVTPPSAEISVDTPHQADAATGSQGDGAAPTGFGGRTVVEDSRAANTETPASPASGRVPPSVPPTDRQ
jgi:hypothetical protein